MYRHAALTIFFSLLENDDDNDGGGDATGACGTAAAPRTQQNCAAIETTHGRTDDRKLKVCFESKAKSSQSPLEVENVKERSHF